MSLYWIDNADGTATVFLPEVAPNTDETTTMDPVTRILYTKPVAAKYKTWFWRNWQPDGICMNCRKRPGLMDPIGGYYSCEECRAVCHTGMAKLVQSRSHAA